jgi:hypothetical protein
VITDHGKQDNALLKRTALILPKEQNSRVARPYQGDQG